MTNNSPDKYILFFEEIDINSKAIVGGKNASLGEMYQHLGSKGIRIPYGFAVTTAAYDRFINFNNLTLGDEKRHDENPESHNFSVGANIRKLIESGTFPDDIRIAAKIAYNKLNKDCPNNDVEVAVRSSAIGEDSETNSFAGQQDTYLNIRGFENILNHIKRCFASLYTDRVICYRKELKKDPNSVKMSVCVQKMVRSDKGTAGVAFTVDTESGFRDAIIINASYGLGETVVGGLVDPDEYTIFKKTGKIIDKKLGSKKEKLVYSSMSAGRESTMTLQTSVEERNSFCLTDSQIEQLGTWAQIIEAHYSGINNRPVDIEWAIDGLTQELFIVQARPVTTVSNSTSNSTSTSYSSSTSNPNSCSDKRSHVLQQFKLLNVQNAKKLITGVAVGERIAVGKVVKMRSVEDINNVVFKKGDILVVDSTTPDWEPVMKLASAIVTNRGGRTCHAAIIAREQGIAAIVGTGIALDALTDNSIVTVSCAEGEIGNVYDGRIDWTITEIDLDSLNSGSNNKVQVMFNLASPELAFKTSMLPNSGVGLAREEFIINNFIKIHPLALLNYDSQEAEVKTKIDKLIVGYKDPLDYYVEKLAFGIAKIGAAFYPNDVIVRFSDFKSNEYRNLLGGARYEPNEENPMIGWRGASRYYSKEFAAAFGLECKAIKRVREEMGLTNVVVMVPFCRTPEELLKVYETMKIYGLERGKAGLRVFLMAEIPSNVILADEFSKYIDGFSIGSNDLTQLVLGLDRDSHLVSHIYDERNPAVKSMISQLIRTAKKNNVKVGICGQAPSDRPDFCRFLVEEGIDSISITSDSLFSLLQTLTQP